MQDPNGLRISCLYSLGCPELKMRGIEKLFSIFLEQNEHHPLSFADIADIVYASRRLDCGYFYRMIAAASGIEDSFCEDVVRSHWVSGALLRPLETAHVEAVGYPNHLMVMKFKWLLGLPPHHNCAVLSLIKDALRQRVEIPEKILSGTNECMVRPGMVIGKSGSSLRVRTIRIGQGKKTVFLSDGEEETIKQGFAFKAKAGDWVSVHFGEAKEVIAASVAGRLADTIRSAFNFFKTGY